MLATKRIRHLYRSEKKDNRICLLIPTSRKLKVCHLSTLMFLMRSANVDEILRKLFISKRFSIPDRFVVGIDNDNKFGILISNTVLRIHHSSFALEVFIS